MECFDFAVTEVLKFEGGYSNDPDDPGGETKYGISKRSFPDIDIAALTKDEAKKIYYEDYWIEAKCDKMPYAVAIVVFDAAVNQGIRRASKAVQKAARSVPDGVIGPKTLRAINNSFENNPERLIDDVCAARGRMYAMLSKQLIDIYSYGWFRRLFHIHKIALSYGKS